MRAVLDTSMVVSGIGWRIESRAVLRLLAMRAFESHRAPWLTEEWFETVERVAATAPSWKNPNWPNWLQWLKTVSKLNDDIPIRKTSRDTNDDPVIMAAVSARANYIVSKDPDLLSLEKPHGIACVSPRQFLSLILR